MTQPAISLPEEIKRALSLLYQPGDVFELRTIEEDGPYKRTNYGYFDVESAADCATKALKLDGKAAIYTTINPCRNELLSRVCRRTKQAGKDDATKDHEIKLRRWLPVDVDALRPRGISASADEAELAEAKSRQIRDYLRSLAFPEPIRAFSGNGCHLLYGIEVANDEQGRILVERCLKALAAKFDDERVAVDVKCVNAARVWKLYGTLAVKGDNTKERPHRRSRLLDVPERIENVSLELLKALAAEAPEAQAPTPHANQHTHAGGSWLDTWLANNFPEAGEPVAWKGTGRIWKLAVCPWDPQHINTASITEQPDGKIGASCFHNSCQGKGWAALRVLKEALKEAGSENTTSRIKSKPAAAPADLVTDGWEPPAPFHEFSLPSFPTEVLTSWWRDYVEGLAEGTQTPVDLSAMLTLAAFSASVARNVRLMVRLGWFEPLNLYIMAALLPALRKSAAVENITRPLSDYEHELIEAMREKIAEAVNDYRILEARLEKAQKDCAKLVGDELEQRREEARELAVELANMKLPVSPQLLCDDVTPEALATLLAEQGGRMALFSAEGGVFEVMAGRYSNGSANFEVYLKAHAGDRLRVNRRGRAEHVQLPALTIGLAVQPDVIRGLAEKPSFRGRGLVGRFLYALPPSNLGSRKIRAEPLADVIRSTYSQKLLRLARIEAHGEDADQARLIRLSPEADDVLAEFEQQHEPKLREDGELGAMGDWAGKLVGAVARIAGILHLADHADALDPWPSQVSAATVRRAIEIGRYLIPHARAAYAEMGADPKVEAAKFLLRWLEREVTATGKATFTKREIHRGCRSRFKTVDELEPGLLLLEAHGYLRDDGKTQARSIRPSHIFRVNPLWEVVDKRDKRGQTPEADSDGESQLSCLSTFVHDEQGKDIAEAEKHSPAVVIEFRHRGLLKSMSQAHHLPRIGQRNLQPVRRWSCERK